MRLRAIVAGSLNLALQAWPPSVTTLISNTWWRPYLRPKTWAPTRQAEAQARRDERRRRTGKPGAAPQSMAALAMPSAQAQPTLQDQLQDQAILQMHMQAAQLAAQAEADTKERMEKEAQARDWHQRHWLQSHVRSALFYSLRTSDVEDDMPVMRATISPLEELGPRPRDSPQGRFPAGLPDAVQEIFPQLMPELASLAEGTKKPADVGVGKDGATKKPPLTAKVTRIRGSPTTAFAFASIMGPPKTPEQPIRNAITMD